MQATTTLNRFGQNVRDFIKLEATAGIVLVVAAVLAMLVKNSPYASAYQDFLMFDGAIRIGPLNIEKPLFLWVNDLWMAIFFFLIGMEIKREVIEGHLSDAKQIVLPAVAALGGIAVPALIFLTLNWHDASAIKGWAVPTATDIAFALGVLSLLGPRIPVTLKVFLLTLAVIDDFAAIAIIAVFYTVDLSGLSLSLAAMALAALALLNYFRSDSVIAYFLVGAVLWACVLKSGVHATLAGVALAMAIPGRSSTDGEVPLLRTLIHEFHPWVAFGILPTFAFVNAGIDFSEMKIANIFGAVPIGIFLGLFIGKQVGVFAFSWAAIRLGIAKLPTGATWTQLYGVSVLCGIGFTMSLFIGALAFTEGGAGYGRADRLAVIVASVLSGLVGYVVLWSTGSKSDPQG